MPLDNVSSVVLVLSGKGGVGKSSVTLQLALSLTQQGHNVGILDIDLTGPSIPRLLGLENAKVKQAPGGWLPVEVHPAVPASSTDQVPTDQNGTIEGTTEARSRRQSRGSLQALSLAFLLPSRSSAVIWRGPKKTAMIRQFVSEVLWPPHTDYLLIDTPPGTSDEHIAIVEELHKIAPPSSIPTSLASANSNGLSNGNAHTSHLTVPRLAGAVVVTTPQAVSTSDVRKELNFCDKTSVPVLGVIENMSGYMCPCCGEITNIFGEGGGKVMAEETGVRFLGSVPMDQSFGELIEGGNEKEDQRRDLLVEKYRSCGLSKVFETFAKIIDESIQVG